MNRSKAAAYGGMGTALSVCLVYLASVLPVNRLTLLGGAGFLTAVVLILSGYRVALLSYAASSLLCWLLVPKKSLVLMYIVFFGWYGIFKSIVELRLSMALQCACKLAAFNASAAALYFAASAFWTVDFSQRLPLYLFWIAANVVFAVYDVAFGLAGSYVQRRVKGILK